MHDDGQPAGIDLLAGRSHRRQLLGAALALGGGLAVTGATTEPASAAARTLSRDDPQAMLDAYVRLRGSTAAETTYVQYDGDIFLARGGEDNIPLVGFRGIAKSHWKPDGAGGYINRDYDVGVFVDYKTGALLKTWLNPVTGETVEVAPYISGPSDGHHKAGIHANDVYGGTGGRWAVVGDSVWQTSSTVLSWPNTLDETLHPLAWSGPRLRTAMSTTYTGRLSEVTDPKRAKASAHLVWNDLLSPSPWMRFGSRPVMCDWRMLGAKAMTKADLDPQVVAEVDGVVPGYIATDAVWTRNSGGWTQYLDRYPKGE